MADGSVEIDAKLNSSPFQKGLSALGGLVSGSGLSKALGGIATGIAAISGALAAAGGFAIKTGMDFDKSMAQVAATMGLTVDQIGGMRDAAIQYGASTAFSATEAAQALNYLALAGYGADKAVEVLPSVLNLAAAGGLDLAYASDLVTDAMAALGEEATASNVTTFGDKMAMTASKANTSVAQLGEAILAVGGTAKTLVGGTTELNTALGVLANRGIKGSEGGIHLRNIILSLTAPTDNASKALKKLGIQVTDSEGKMRSLDDIMLDFNAATEGMSTAAKMDYLSQIFNKTDLAAVQALLAGCGEEWDELEGYISEADGAMSRMAKTQLDNLSGDVENLSGALESLGISAYDKVQGPLREIVQLGTSLVEELTTSLTEGGFDAFAAKLGDVLATAVTELSSRLPALAQMAVSVVKSLASGLKKNAPTLAKAAANVFSTLATGIVDILPDLLLAAASLFEELAANLPELLSSIWEAVKSIDWIALGRSILESILNGLGSIASGILGLFSDSIPLVEGLDWSSLGTNIIAGLGDIANWFSGLFGDGKSLIEGFSWSDIGTKIKNGVGALGSWLSGLFSSGKTDAENLTWSDLGTKIVDGIGDLGAAIFGAFSAGKTDTEEITWSDVGTSIVTGVQTALDTGGAFLSASFTAGKAAVEAIDWNTLGTTIGNAFNDLVDVTGEFLSAGFTAAQATISAIDWTALGTTIGTAFNDLVDATGAFLSGGFTAAKATIEAIDWDSLGTTIGDAFNGVVDTTGAFLSGGFTAAQTAIEAIDWAALGETVAAPFNGIIDSTGAFISGGFTAAKTAIEEIDWAGIGGNIATAFNGIVDATGEFLSGGFTAAATAIQEIKWADIGSDIASGLNSAWDIVSGIGEFALGAGLTVVDAGNAGLQAVRGWLGLDNTGGESGNDAKQAGQDVVANIAAGVDAEVPTLELSASTAATALLDAFKTAVGSAEGGSATEAKSIGESVVSGMADGITEKAVESTFSDCASSVFVAIATAFSTSFGFAEGSSATNFKIVGNGVVSGIVDGIEAKAVETTFSSAASTVASTAQASLETACAESKFAYIGKMICEGVEAGIDRYSYKIADAAKKAAEKAFEEAKRALEISSPSRRFAELGMYCMLGLSKGLTENSDEFTNAYHSIIDDAKSYLDKSGLLNAVAERMRVAVEGKTTAAVDAAELKEVLGIDYEELAHAIWDEAPEELGITQTINFNQPVKTPDETARELRFNNTQGLVGAKT